MLLELLIAVIVMGLLYWLVTLLPIPQPFKNIAIVIIVLICILWLLSFTGLLSPYWPRHPVLR
jgi:hypothetical protein